MAGFGGVQDRLHSPPEQRGQDEAKRHDDHTHSQSCDPVDRRELREGPAPLRMTRCHQQREDDDGAGGECERNRDRRADEKSRIDQRKQLPQGHTLTLASEQRVEKTQVVSPDSLTDVSSPDICPRCASSLQGEDYYGVCAQCRTQLREVFSDDARDVVAAEYEPKMNVVPNAIASKE